MTRFAPLILPAQLNDLPQGYGQRLPLFDENSPKTTKKDIFKVTDFIDLEEVDVDNAKMRIKAQSFSGDVKTCFRSLTANSIATLYQLVDAFIT